MLAAIREPSRFRALILLDPTILRLPPLFDWVMWGLQRIGRAETIPVIGRLAGGAIRRRNTFESVDAAVNYFREKPLFSDWPEETVRLYAESALQPATNGSERQLRWSPDWEAQAYRVIYPFPWRDVPKLRGLLPVLTLRGTQTDTFLRPAAEKMRAILPDMTYHEIEGGHLFPQSAPTATATIIGEWLAGL